MARPVGRASRSASLQLHRASRTLAAAPVRLAAILARDPGALMLRLAWVELPFLPVVALHSFVYNRFHYTSARRSLPAFLVTRTLYTGAGRVVPGETPLLRTAQRPEFLRSLARMFTSGDKRPLIETRDLFFRPWSAFTSRRRLHLLGADANLADHALVLRAGATALVLEALETDPEWRWPRLKDPLAAFREVARDPAMSARLPLVGEPAATALAIQRRYLEGAREVLAPALAELPPDHWKTRVLAMWEETLDALEEHPESLADRVDWIAKAALLHREVPDPAARAALERPEADVLRRPRGGDPALRAAAFRALRLDLRYHELGPRGGHRRLLETGRMRSLVSDDAVRRARLEPPPDTRAAARGRAIRDAARGAGGATWHRVRVGRTEWRFLPDPLSPEPGFVLRLPEAWAPGKSGG
jgi:proteasome accessory factor A